MKNFKKISREGLKSIVGGKRNPYEMQDQITICYNLLYCYSTSAGDTAPIVWHVGTDQPPQDAHNAHVCGWTPVSLPLPSGCA
ncbi:hypothetical protein [uncultured Chryseobacterium sp.]|uniref:bacteriocin-like protein n=1 Tax=uncultured Chryseobacterium sp. TaxID=259322 RepID=UPI0025F46AA3|nr:hypothetical protein [uncultured Chryseobacterium sp.]